MKSDTEFSGAAFSLEVDPARRAAPERHGAMTKARCRRLVEKLQRWLAQVFNWDIDPYS